MKYLIKLEFLKNTSSKKKMPFCELQLGKRDLYPNVNFKSFEGTNLKEHFTRNILNILSYADEYIIGHSKYFKCSCLQFRKRI